MGHQILRFCLNSFEFSFLFFFIADSSEEGHKRFCSLSEGGLWESWNMMGRKAKRSEQAEKIASYKPAKQ